MSSAARSWADCTINIAGFDLRQAQGVSATSKAGRDMRASAGRPYLPELERDLLQRAHDLADRLGGDAGIERRGVELGMTERTRAIMLPFYVIESQSAAGRDRLLADGARRSAHDKRQCPRP
jgi:hypothetical protein